MGPLAEWFLSKVQGKDLKVVRRHLIRSGDILGVRPGSLRIAIRAYNNPSDIERVIEAIKEMKCQEKSWSG
jgi:selenocysteine lyase/cysteine desulfurase